VKDTWLYERYDSEGNQIRTAFYFEYPSLVAMMLTEIRYGLEMNLASISVAPFQAEGALDYSFSFGTLSVDYSTSSAVTLRFPGSGYVRALSVARMLPGGRYAISYEGPSLACAALSPLQATADSKGVVRFSSPVLSDCAILIQLSPATSA
jgi:hypothetical protein